MKIPLKTYLQYLALYEEGPPVLNIPSVFSPSVIIMEYTAGVA